MRWGILFTPLIAPRRLAASGAEITARVELRGYASTLGIEMAVPLDPDYQVVFPGRQRVGEDWLAVEARQVEAATRLGERWAALEPHLVADRLAELTREALVVGHTYPDHSRTVCRVIAERTGRPLEWIRALDRADCQGGQVEPFLRRLVEVNDPSWPKVAEEFLARPSWMHLVVELVLSTGESPPSLLDLVLEKLDSRCSDFLWTMALRGQFPEHVQRSLLEHRDDSVAGSAAVGEWEAEPKGFVREALRTSWRQAILRCTTYEHWLGEILQADPTLAHEWLVNHLPRLLTMPVRYDELIVAAASGLSRESRTKLLELVPKDHWDGWIVSVLIGDDLELYRSMLDSPEWERKHLDPLIWPINRQRIFEGPDLGPSWVEKARVAMAAGYSPEDLASAKLDTEKGWSGLKSLMWQGWADAFQGLEGQDDPLVRRLAMAGSKIASERRDRAAKQERINAVYRRW
jgi:hypothetical protein